MDMAERLLNSVVDHVLSHTGLTKEKITEGVLMFFKKSKEIDATLARIEHNQLLLIEAENERRQRDGKPAISGYIGRPDA